MNSPSNSYNPQTEFSFFPPALKHLIIVTVLVYIASWTPGIGKYLQIYAPLYPMKSPHFYPWQFVTYLFMHANFLHIFFNLFALWMFGQAIENYWGSKRFLIYFFLCGIGGGLAYVLINNNPVMTTQGLEYIPTVGNSGAVFGILLAFGMMFPDRPIIFLFFPFPIKAKYFVAMYGALELFSGITGTEQGVAHFAHIGGMVVGFILIKYWGIGKQDFPYS
ncbi:MAG TPA: rhomboid family intramembrane serine protease [Balneolaceae bacterium]|nr:rhomboid family intramembrane serine protease [Balneolaceae bacterium]